MDAAELVKLSDSIAYQNPDQIRAILAELRRTRPVCKIEPDDIRPYWAITRYADIKTIETSPELFSVEPRANLILESLEQINMERYGDIMGVKTLVHMDGPRHLALRKVTRDWFMPANVAKLRDHIDLIAGQFIQTMKSKGGECDFAADIAFWYPLRIILHIIGIPEADDAKILGLTQRLFAPEAYVEAGVNTTDIYLDTMNQMAEYFTAFIEQCRSNPKDDIGSLLSNAKIDGEWIDPFTLISYFILLTTAGHDTTSASIAGGLHALIEYPEQRQTLLNNPDLRGNAVDEIIRWVTPVKNFARTVLADTELSGTQLQKGDTVALFFESGNRDGSVYANADSFDITRENNRHVAFGFGRHNCLGMHLARMEIDSFFYQLLPQLSQLELNGEPSYIPSYFVSGISNLPIRFQFKN